MLAGVNEFTQLYIWEVDDSEERLHLLCERRGCKLGLDLETKLGSYALVSDLFKSISLIKYQLSSQGPPLLTEIAHDFDKRWMLATNFMEDHTFVGSEYETLALFIAKRRMCERYTDLEKGKMEVRGLFYLGDTINQFRRGSLTISLSGINLLGIVASAVFGTPTGSIGVVSSLEEKMFQKLMVLQNYMENNESAIASVGGLSHKQWRSVRMETRFEPAVNFIDDNFIQHFMHFSPERRESIEKYFGLSHHDFAITVDLMSCP